MLASRSSLRAPAGSGARRLVVAAAAAAKGKAPPKKSAKGFGAAKPAEQAGPLRDGCPCGAKAHYKSCCKPFHTGAAVPPTVEATVRARFSAILKKDVSFLLRSTHAHFIEAWAPDEPDATAALRKLQDDLWNTVEHYTYTNLRIRGVEPSERHPDEEQVATFSYTLYDERTPLIDDAGNKARKVITEQSTFIKNPDSGLWQLAEARTVEVPESFARAAEQQAKDMAAAQQAAGSGAAA